MSLPDVVAEWRTETIDLGDRTLKLTIPARPDALLDHPDVLKESAESDYAPYWGYLWQTARDMAKLVYQADWPAASRVLELGCGCGLVGLAAVAAGHKVTLTDNREEALQLTRHNVDQNGLSNTTVTALDWLNPSTQTTYPIVLASDVLYEARFHVPLLNLMETVVANNGQCWIGDPGRGLMLEFVRAAQSRGWEPTVYDKEMTPRSFPVIGQVQLLVFERGCV